MAEITAGVSWIAVIVGAVVSFALGALWFSPKMFGICQGIFSSQRSTGLMGPRYAGV